MYQWTWWMRRTRDSIISQLTGTDISNLDINDLCTQFSREETKQMTDAFLALKDALKIEASHNMDVVFVTFIWLQIYHLEDYIYYLSLHFLMIHCLTVNGNNSWKHAQQVYHNELSLKGFCCVKKWLLRLTIFDHWKFLIVTLIISLW